MELQEFRNKVCEYLAIHFPEYTTRMVCNNVYVYIQDSFQKDINITDKIPYVSIYLSHRSFKYGEGFRVEWSSLPYFGRQKKTVFKEEHLTKKTIYRMVRNKIKKFKVYLEEQKKRNELVEIKRKETDRLENERRARIIQYLTDINLNYRVDNYLIYIQQITKKYGSFDVILDDGFERISFHLDEPNLGLYVPPMIWHELNNFTPGAICLVIVSELYTKEVTVNSYETFKKIVVD